MYRNMNIYIMDLKTKIIHGNLSLGDKVKEERKDSMNQSYLFIYLFTHLFRKYLLSAMSQVLFLELGTAWDMQEDRQGSCLHGAYILARGEKTDNK